MGFGKYLAGGLCVIGAVVAAPIVLPAAAAAGAAVAAGAASAAAAVGTAAAAAGTAVAGSAVGTAVAGTATAVGSAAAAAGTAVASSAAATAVGGAMATVGTAVGSAASVAGISSVATIAGTTAGATAVGTMSTAVAVGAASAASGAKKLSDAKEIVENANARYNAAKEKVDQLEKDGNEALAKLGHVKISVWDSFKDFHTVISKVKNCKVLDGKCSKENVHLSKDELDKIQTLSVTASDLLKTSAGSIGLGALAGLAMYKWHHGRRNSIYRHPYRFTIWSCSH